MPAKDTRPIEVRFWEKVDKRDPDECWPWKGTLSNGYGVLSVNRRKVRASRLSFRIAYGQEPEGEACHHCDNPPCVNPAHLFDGSHRENMHDSRDKGRMGGWAGRNATRTHCANGHEFTPENTHVDGTGERVCRACRVARVAKWRINNREKVREWDRRQRAKARGGRQGG